MADRRFSIRVEIDAEDWVIASESIAQFMRPTFDGPTPAGTCHELWVFGPFGTVWFETGSRRVGYAGSVLYLCCQLHHWLRELPDSLTIPSESVFQSAELTVTRSEGEVELRFNRGASIDQISAPREDCQEALRSFVTTFTAEAMSRWRDVVDADSAFRWES